MKQLTPRQGTKTGKRRVRGRSQRLETTCTPPGDENSIRAGSRFNLLFGNNLHPVRGRKHPSRAHDAIHNLGNNLHPARGRKPPELCRVDTRGRKQLTPRQGTKTAQFLQCDAAGHRKQLTPRQGTKTVSEHFPVNSHNETTYAPSGDENLNLNSLGARTRAKQLTPRQGTKTKSFVNSLFFCILKQPTPRQGTKISQRAPMSCYSARNNLRPVRGRKHLRMQ